jgi:type VI protein secretion system component VasK
MSPEASARSTAAAARSARRFRPRRPWMLIAACLLLVGLTVTLWGKWIESRDRADRLAVELRKVYAEAEKLRTEANAAKQRITQLERQLRRPAAPAPRPAAPATEPR